MKISIVGGGPAGLFLSILLRRAFPNYRVQVFEKNPANVTWGWGVVFSEETLSRIAAADPESYAEIQSQFVRWDAIDIHFKDRVIRSGGHDFVGLRRSVLLQLLQDRAQQLGAELFFEHPIEDIAAFVEEHQQDDLIVGADGVHSRVREFKQEDFEPEIALGKSRFIWLGADRDWEAFTFLICESEWGVFQVHAYPFDRSREKDGKVWSTFIVECDEATWQRAGLEHKSEAENVAFCEKLFQRELEGASLHSNHSRWIRFPTLKCARWASDNILLLGDAAHTAHFSIGSGTKLAMEDAIEFVDALKREGQVKAALESYYEARWLDVAKLQRSAGVSQKWFEDLPRYIDFDPEAFSCSLLSRSKRVTYENLRIRDAKYVGDLDRWFATTQKNVDARPALPPMFQPFKLREMCLENRVVLSPMCQYSAEDGTVGDWHLVHLGSRAVGGAGLLIAEMTAVSAEARITPGCAGIYKAEHVDAWKRVVDFVHNNSQAKIALQLGHAGRKGSTQRLWEEADRPLKNESDNWELISASPIAWSEANQVPREMTRADMQHVIQDFVQAAKYAEQAGFDMLEIHFAHGYLLACFISPLTNQRSDEYGGSLENRLRFPLEVFDAVRAVWPKEKPISVRISATDWTPDGLTEDDAVEMARQLQAHGCDLIDVSAGQTVPGAKPVYGRMFQTPFSDRIRNEVGIATIAVGNIQGGDHVNTILASNRADLCALARPHLYDPYVTVHAAAEQGVPNAIHWPSQYRSAASVATRIAGEHQEARIERSRLNPNTSEDKTSNE